MASLARGPFGDNLWTQTNAVRSFQNISGLDSSIQRNRGGDRQAWSHAATSDDLRGHRATQQDWSWPATGLTSGEVRHGGVSGARLPRISSTRAWRFF